ncbi:diacylglycerol kinase [Tabrizicola sp. J26]|uniref:diacylglycerol/lipid kinase family protein n=1 Tax=Alitabrizicola rongguiensis TaxID=2909234 RepID=UPI001F25A683|nr:diacylglycerol kinase family protein [Tabrizicola rongguiensis]MCF1709858.1 diacylglycerol kinase [Tabrizicola rongguiensis]
MPPARPIDLSVSRLSVVLNAASGRKDALAKERIIRETLEPAVAGFAVHAARKGSAILGAAQEAVREGADIVVALGGDGTQSAVAGILAGSEAVMAVLPGGTFNYFARGLGVGETLEAALDTILTGQVATVDLGEVNGRLFLNNASFGIYPEILERREAIYRRWGRSRLAAYWSVLLALRDLRDPMHLALTVAEETRHFHTPLAFAARSPYQLEALGLDGAEAVRDGHFALFLAKGKRPTELMLAAIRLAFGSVSHGQDFDLVIADELTIDTRHPTRLVAFDGEKARLTGPFHLRMHRDALSVIVPAAETA